METYLLQQLSPLPVTSEAFRPFGQVVTAQEDGNPFSEADADLSLQGGTPRFYIMRLHDRGLKFHKITRHLQCTQCLGALEGKEWLLAVAPSGKAPAPNWEEIQVFRIPGSCFIKLETGTWHAGPYFESARVGRATVDFYNLELNDTNVADHDTCNLLEQYGVEFEILPTA